MPVGGFEYNDPELFWKIRTHKAKMLGFEQARQSAVCLPFVRGENGEWQILFEVRSSDLPEQPGDICLPGGMLEQGELPMEAALRELSEELLIPEDQAEVIGEGDVLYQPSIIIHTFAVRLRNYQGTANEEVAEVFAVPLSFFLENEPEVFYVRRSAEPEENFPFERIQGGKDYQWRSSRDATYFYQWKEKTIWGLTAKIMRDFIRTLKE